MSVLIKGMKMPESCGTCFVGNRTICKNGCPLGAFPDHHGRLVDADAIIKEMESMKVEGEVFTTAVNYAAIVAREAPTVIEAEGDEE